MSIDCVMRATNLFDARRKLRHAQDELEAAVKENFPVGSEVQWRRGKAFCKGVVTEHAYGDRLFARNYKTGRSVTIGSYEICQGAV